MGKVEVGDKVPSFHVKDHKGYPLTDKDLFGTTTVLFVYAKDDTPKCTTESCDFQSHLKKFSELDVLLLGASPDSIESHQNFIKKHNLRFTLLSDPDKKLCHSLGALHEDKVVRATFVIDAHGIIQWIEKPVHVEGHIDRVIAAIEKFCPPTMKNAKSLQDDYINHLKKTFPQDEKKEKK